MPDTERIYFSPTETADHAESWLGSYPNPATGVNPVTGIELGGYVPMKGAELELADLRDRSDYLFSRIDELEQRKSALGNTQKPEGSFFYTFGDDDHTEITITGNDITQEGVCKRERTIHIALKNHPIPVEIALRSERGESTSDLPEKYTFRFRSATEFRVNAAGERLPLENTAHTFRRIDESLGIVERVWDVFAQKEQEKQLLSSLLRADVAAAYDAAQQAFRETDAESVCLVEFEPGLSEKTVDRVSGELLSRVDSITQRLPAKLIDREHKLIYTTDGTVLIQFSGFETGRQAQSKQGQIGITPLLPGESFGQGLARVAQEEADPWKIHIWLAHEPAHEGESQVAYMDEHTFWLSEPREPGTPSEKVPVSGTVRAIQFTDAVLSRLEKLTR